MKQVSASAFIIAIAGTLVAVQAFDISFNLLASGPATPAAQCLAAEPASCPSCLVKNEANHLIASLGSAADSAILSFTSKTFTLYQSVQTRAMCMFDEIKAVAEELATKVTALIASHPGWSTNASLRWIVTEANSTLHTIGAMFEELSTQFQGSVSNQSEALLYEMVPLVGAGIFGIIVALQTGLNATAPPVKPPTLFNLFPAAPLPCGLCSLTYTQAISLDQLVGIEQFTEQCMGKYATAVQTKLTTYEWIVNGMVAAIRALISGSSIDSFDVFQVGLLQKATEQFSNHYVSLSAVGFRKWLQCNLDHRPKRAVDQSEFTHRIRGRQRQLLRMHQWHQAAHGIADRTCTKSDRLLRYLRANKLCVSHNCAQKVYTVGASGMFITTNGRHVVWIVNKTV